MSYHVGRHQREFEKKESEVFNLYRDFGRMAPTVMARHELIADLMEQNQVARHLNKKSNPKKSVKDWFTSVFRGSRARQTVLEPEGGALIAKLDDSTPVGAN